MVDDLNIKSDMYHEGVRCNTDQLKFALLKATYTQEESDLIAHLKTLSLEELLEEVAEALYNNPLKRSVRELYAE